MKISFCIPCYNVADYINKCIESFYATSLHESDFEVICYNDCSTDNTQEVLEHYARQHANFQVLQGDENAYIGGGRNACLREAKGEYIWFVDADDMVVSEKVTDVLEIAQDHQLDVLAFNYKETDANGKVLKQPKVFTDSQAMLGVEFVNKYFGENVMQNIGYPWRFLVRRQWLVMENITFAEQVCWEDTDWVLKILLLPQSVMSISTAAYVHVKTDGAISVSFNREYSAKKIYEYTIPVSERLYDFAGLLSDYLSAENAKKYTTIIEKSIKKHYINRLSVYLCRTNRANRIEYHKIIRSMPPSKRIVENSSTTTKLLYSVVGFQFSQLLALVYRVKHLFK